MKDCQRYYKEGWERAMGYGVSLPRRRSGGVTGAHLAATVGNSLEFMDYRDYQPGDDLRWIDWGAYARSDKLVVKLYREEVTPHLEVILDVSRSMEGVGSRKGEAALGLTAFFAQAADNADFTHRVYLTESPPRELANGRDLPERWGDIAFDAVENPQTALSAGMVTLKPKSIRVFISDLFWLDDPGAMLTMLSHQAAGLCVVQLVSENELNPEVFGNVSLVDVESGAKRELVVDARALTQYRDSFDEHYRQWLGAARHYGAVLVRLNGDKLLNDWDVSALLRHELIRMV